MSVTKLPRIENRGSKSAAHLHNSAYVGLGNAHNESSQYISPFRLPTDDEVFVYRDEERKKREEIKHLSKDLRIWDKRTGTTRRPLRSFKDAEVFEATQVRTRHVGFNNREKTVIAEAQKIIIERRKDKGSYTRGPREGNLELLEKKKEIFLVERTVGILEKEKEVLIERGNEKDDALKKSEEMLEKDWKEFESYKHENKYETELALQKLNQEIEGRKKKEVEFKVKNTDFITLKSEKSKNEELIQKYQDAKDFLTKLTPKDYSENMKQQLRNKIEECRNNWLEKEFYDKEESLSSVSENPIKTNQYYNKEKKVSPRKHTKSDLDKVFEEKLARDDIDEIETFKYDQKMYFDNPQQMVEILTRLEEGNLAIIQSMQDTEQSLELLRNTLKQKKIDFERKIGGLRDNKNHLDKSKAEREEKVKLLTQRVKEPKYINTQSDIAPIRKKILEIASIFREGNKLLVDEESTSTLDALTLVELQLYKQLERLNEYKPARIVELKKQLEDVRKGKNRKIQVEKELAQAEEKSKKANERLLETTTRRRKGRMDMKKYIIFERKERSIEVAHNTDEEEDLKYFKPYMTEY